LSSLNGGPSQLREKRLAWKKLMLSALDVAKAKLPAYYSDTDKVHGDPFAIGTILAPQHKLQLDWGPESREQYRQSFENYAGLYKERLSTTQGSPQASSSGIQTSEIDSIFAPDFELSAKIGIEFM
jgi:hypothetical protein